MPLPEEVVWFQPRFLCLRKRNLAMLPTGVRRAQYSGLRVRPGKQVRGRLCPQTTNEETGVEG